jgi:hypothetical protein
VADVQYSDGDTGYAQVSSPYSQNKLALSQTHTHVYSDSCSPRYGYSPNVDESWGRVQTLICRTLEIRRSILGPEHPLCERTQKHLDAVMRRSFVFN